MQLRALKYLLFVSPRQADLWRRTGGSLRLVASFAADTPDFAQQLAHSLSQLKILNLSLLLDLPELSVETEPTPQAGYLDRRKIIARRLDYLHPRAALTGFQIGTTGSTQLFALRPHPALTAALGAIGRVGAGIGWIAHAGLEAGQWIGKSDKASGFCCLRLGHEGLLLAHAGQQVLAVRRLAADRLQPDALAAELASTYQYLQRHGWRPEQALALRVIGLPPPTVNSLRLTPVLVEPQTDAYTAMLARLVRNSPSHRLQRQRLAMRHALLRIEAVLRVGATLALLLVIAAALGGTLLMCHLQRQADAARQAAAALPTPLAIGDEATYRRLKLLETAPATLAGMLGPDGPPQRLSYVAPAEGSAPTLQWDGAAPTLSVDWQEQATTPTLSGTIGAPTASAAAHSYTYKAAP